MIRQSLSHSDRLLRASHARYTPAVIIKTLFYTLILDVDHWRPLNNVLFV
uniref:Uncharacterized protein n=1 Tax=Anguilla anguilla TaxID=7936 RepID=A0A0E9VAY4_ANGAN